ncbi:MAG: LamG domain-containing protein, partial [Planctomycetota bacterium]
MFRKPILLALVVLAMGLAGPVQREAAADPNLVLWYKLDAPSGAFVQDDSGYNHHGDIETWPDELPINWEPDGGHDGGCLVFFDDTRINVPKSALDKVSDSITISLWLKDAWRVGQNWTFDAATGWEEPFRITAAIGTAPDSEVLWQAGGDVNDTVRWDGGNVQDLEGWHLWTFVKDEVADNIRIYMDGVPAASKSSVDDTLADVLPVELVKEGFVFRVGASSSHYNHLKGKVDEFRVYDRALSDDEVVRVYYTGGDTEVAWKPSPVDGTEDLCDDVVLSWTPGDSAIMHDIYFGTDRDNVENATAISPEYRTTQGPNSYDAGALETLNPGVTYYWRIDEISGVVTKGDVWEFAINDGSAFDPAPGDGEQAVLKETILSWSAGCSAVSHRVYFSTDLDDVEGREAAAYLGETGTTSIDPCAGDLDYLTDYYWAVDEVNG